MTKINRTARIARTTAETEIALDLDLDGTGAHRIATGIGFFDHMLEQLARHSLIDLALTARGDTHIDDHHTVEDCGIALGQALAAALGDKAGICRYGDARAVMDEALCAVALDLSGRAHLEFHVGFPRARIGTFDTELVAEFFAALARSGGISLHADLLRGANAHHIAESLFKALARALRQAVSIDPRQQGRIPSTKGSLDAS